jgi:hypothetical protein
MRSLPIGGFVCSGVIDPTHYPKMPYRRNRWLRSRAFHSSSRVTLAFQAGSARLVLSPSSRRSPQSRLDRFRRISSRPRCDHCNPHICRNLHVLNRNVKEPGRWSPTFNMRQPARFRAQPAAHAKHCLSFESPLSPALDVISRIADAVATVGPDVVAVAFDRPLLRRLPQE